MLSVRQADELAIEFQKKLRAVPVDSLARQSSFVERTPRKISPVNFLLSFFILALTGGNSLTALATTIGLIAGCTISKQAIDQRIKQPLLKFLELILAACLSITIKNGYHTTASVTLILCQFHRVLVQDSTCIHLPKKLAKYFPGSKNAKNKSMAIAKIQTIFDLVSERFLYFRLSSFTRNDQSAASDIFSILRVGDLVIRDLGYFVLSVFQRLQLQGGFFLSRLRYGVNLYETDGKTPVDLLHLLKTQSSLNRQVRLGAKEKLRVRLVAIPVPEAVAAERRRKYKGNRDRRLNPSAEHLTLLGWDIFITNIPSAMLTPKQIAELYDLRWRIEIIFKSWKSHFHMTNMPTANVVRVTSYIYAMLIFITLFQTYIFVQLYREHLAKSDKQLSLLKIAQFYREQIWAMVLFGLHLDKVKEQIFYHCGYESRQDRENYAQKAQSLP